MDDHGETADTQVEAVERDLLRHALRRGYDPLVVAAACAALAGELCRAVALASGEDASAVVREAAALLAARAGTDRAASD